MRTGVECGASGANRIPEPGQNRFCKIEIDLLRPQVVLSGVTGEYLRMHLAQLSFEAPNNPASVLRHDQSVGIPKVLSLARSEVVLDLKVTGIIRQLRSRNQRCSMPLPKLANELDVGVRS